MANPRKFSEKIALQKQKQAEGTAEFEKIMNEVKATRVVDGTLGNTDLTDVSSLHRNASLSGGSGGSGTSSGASGGGASPDTNAGGGIGGGGGGGVGGMGVNATAGSPTAYRESRGRSVGVGPMRRPSERKQDRSPYGSTASGLMLSGMTPNTQNSYLSPPMDTSWRRSNSDSALHQTLNMAEGNFGTSSPVASMMNDLNSLHANYHHHHHHNQRSHSPNIGRSYSPQAQRRKNTLLHQQQQQLQQQHNHQQQLQQQRLQMQQAQQQQHHHQQQLQQHLQNQQHQSLHQQQQQHQLQQQQQQYNAKFNNSNIMFKSLQEQQLGFNNTGSLPDLTSVHYGSQTSNPQMMQPSSQQQQQTLSPILSPHHNNGCHERDQSPSPFSPPSTGGSAGGPPSPYHQQQNSPTSAANTPTANAQTSPHLSFNNLSVQSPVQQTTAQQNTVAAFSTLPTLGAASSTGNLTDYRQPLNPPSPGSSPGLLTSGPVAELHTSAPPSPIRHSPNNINTTGSAAGAGGTALQNAGQQQQQQQQQMTTQSLQNAFGPIDSNTGYNTLNPAFHNHFEQFHLGDNSQSPQNNYDALEFEDFGGVTSSTGNQQHNTFNSKIIDFGDLTSTSSSSSNNTRTNTTNTTTNCNNNNNNLPGVQQQQRNNSQQFQQQQQHLNNNSTTNTSSSNTHTNGPVTCRTHNTGIMNNNDRQDILSGNSSPIPSPLSHCVPSPSSPLPIPMSAHSPTHHHHHQQQQQQLSLSVQTSPHHSPMHSPHHSPSPLSVSSPGLTMLGGSISPVPSPSAHIMQHQQQQQQHNHINNQTASQMHHQNQTSHAHVNHQQTHTPSTTATNIPQIIFSDYSSSRDIFDNLDLDLGQIDGPGLQMLSDQNPIMIADPSIEDSFRRDLN